MRLSFVLPALAAGSVLGWAALAWAQPAPPAAPPIFYCPAPSGAAGPEAPAAPGHYVHHRSHHPAACPSHHQFAGERHHWRHHERLAMAGPRQGPPAISESQGRVYHYRSGHGIGVFGAEEGWGHGPPPCPQHPPGCPFAGGGRGAIFRLAGRDEFGYLIWPGKTAPADVK